MIKYVGSAADLVRIVRWHGGMVVAEELGKAVR